MTSAPTRENNLPATTHAANREEELKNMCSVVSTAGGQEIRDIQPTASTGPDTYKATQEDIHVLLISLAIFFCLTSTLEAVALAVLLYRKREMARYTTSLEQMIELN